MGCVPKRVVLDVIVTKKSTINLIKCNYSGRKYKCTKM